MREPWMVLASGYIVHGNRIARLDPRGAFAWLAQLRGIGADGDPAGRDRSAPRRARAVRRRSVGPARGAAVRDRERVAAAVRQRARRRARRAGLARRRTCRRPSPSTTAGTSSHPDSGATTFDSVRRLLIRRDLAVEQAALSRAGAGRVLAAVGLRVRPAALRDRRRRGFPPPSASSSPKAGASRRKGAPSDPSSRCAPTSGRASTGSSCTARSTSATAQVVALPRLLEAFRHGRATVTLDDGTTGIVPEEWLRSWAGIAGVGETTGDHVRFKMSQVALLDAALEAQPAVSVDERFARVRDELSSFSGIAPLDAAPSFAGQLRDYQRDALGWFAFLRRFGFGGCLADDMGLGKTVMVLAWLDRLRAGASEVDRARRWSSCRARWSSTGRKRPRASRRSCACSTSAAPTARSIALDGLRHRPHHLRHAAARRAAAQGRRVRVRDSRRGADDQEREHGGGEGRAADPREASAGAERHADREPSRRAVEPVRVPESRAARHLVRLRAAPRRGARSRIASAIDVLARGIRPFILRRTKAQVAPELPARTELTMHCDLVGRAARAVRRAARSLPRRRCSAASRATGCRSRRCTCSRRCCGCARRPAIPA